MAVTTPTKPATGNATEAVPKPQWKPIKIEEAKQFDKFINKPFVPKGDVKFAKEYFVRPISVMRYTPADISTSTSEFGLKFLVQKFHRNKMHTVGLPDGKGGRTDIEDNLPVTNHILNEEGFWECKDPMAVFTMDVRDFRANYEADKGDEE